MSSSSSAVLPSPPKGATSTLYHDPSASSFLNFWRCNGDDTLPSRVSFPVTSRWLLLDLAPLSRHHYNTFHFRIPKRFRDPPQTTETPRRGTFTKPTTLLVPFFAVLWVVEEGPVCAFDVRGLNINPHN